MGTTTRGAFPYPAGSDAANTLDTQIQSLAQRCADIGVIFSQGSFATRPVSTAPSPGVEGRIYYATDTGVIYYDYGTGWVDILNVPDDSITAAKIAADAVGASEIAANAVGASELADNAVDTAAIVNDAVTTAKADSAGILVPGGISESGVVRRGKSIIATEESRTNAAYGMLPTQDRVASVVLPTDGLLRVGFQAIWKESITSAARVAIFLGSNQLKSASGVAPVVQEASLGADPSIFQAIGSHSGGLAGSSGSQAQVYGGDVTTGQVLGLSPFGFVTLFAAAGTYDVSIRFKSSPLGTVTAKERKLWVEAIGF